MTRAGKSMFYFSLWIVLCGISLMFFPTFCLSIAGLPVGDLTVVRLMGMVLIFLSIYYFVSARYPAFWPLYRVTVFTRFSALFIVIIMVFAGIVKPVVIGFVAVDACGAFWTALALRLDMKEGLCNV